MKWKKVIAAGIAAGIVILLVGNLTGFLFYSDYSATPQLWKSMTGNWYYNMVILDIFEGMLYAMVFSLFYSSIPGRGWRKGVNFGFVLWLIATVPGMLMTYFTMAVPDSIVMSWLFGGLVSLLIAGPVIAVVHDRIK